jgi:hypothetical protein
LEIFNMTAGVSARIDVSVTATNEGTGDLGNPTVSNSAVRSLIFTPGNDAVTKADILWSDTRTLVASATENLDLNGVLLDAFGANANFAEVVALWVEAASTNTNNVVIGGAASNQFVGPFGAGTHTLALGPGEFVLLSSKNGWAVTAGTGDLLKVANSAAGTSVKYNIMVIGRSVAA